MLIRTKQSLRKIIAPLARGLAGMGVPPNFLTILGLAFALLAAGAVASGRNLLGLAGLVGSGLCDILDGDVARLMPGRTSRFGAFLDSTFDRIADAFLLGGLLVGKLHHGGGLTGAWVGLWMFSLVGSFLVSYARARAEGLGIACQVGVADRSLRFLLIAIMFVAGYRWTVWLLAIIALLAWITVAQRIRHVYGQARASAGPPEARSAP
jgi:CDP-diacylglycerol--glycerol-3-phosphate 3-phosphatidyltransferase